MSATSPHLLNVDLEARWCGCGGVNGFIQPLLWPWLIVVSSTPCGVAVVVVMVSSTPCGVAVVVLMVSSSPCGVAVVDSGFIHPLWCGCGAGNGGGNGYTAPGSCGGRPPCGPVACSLSLVVYMKVHTRFILFVRTPLWFCGLWSGPCGLHEVYGLFIEGFDRL